MKPKEIEFIATHNVWQTFKFAIKILLLKLTSRATWLMLSGTGGLAAIFYIIFKYDGRVLHAAGSGIWITGIIIFTFLILAGKGSKYLSKYIELIRELKKGEKDEENDA